MPAISINFLAAFLLRRTLRTTFALARPRLRATRPTLRTTRALRRARRRTLRPTLRTTLRTTRALRRARRRTLRPTLRATRAFARPFLRALRATLRPARFRAVAISSSPHQFNAGITAPCSMPMRSYGGSHNTVNRDSIFFRRQLKEFFDACPEPDWWFARVRAQSPDAAGLLVALLRMSRTLPSFSENPNLS